MTGAAEATDAPFCPYRGLRPYTSADRAYFFGRTSDAGILAGSTLARRLTVLFGGSGVGKTSVLRAGAAPLVEETTGVEPIYFNTWQSEDFLDRFHLLISEALPAGSIPQARTLPALSAAWDEQHVAIPAPDDVALARQPAPLVLLLDQFEEFFLYREGPREAFTIELAELINRRELDARVVLSLRDDRLALLERLAPRIPDILTNRIELEPLDYRGAKAACEKPVERYNEDGNADRGDAPPITLAPALVEQVLAAVLQRDPDDEGPIAPESLKASRFDTAYLQLALTKVWEQERAAGSTGLRGETFTTLGGGPGIAAAHLDGELRQLSADELFLCGRFFDRLVTSGGSKIAQPYDALRDAALPPHDAHVRSLIQLFYHAVKQWLLGVLLKIRAKRSLGADRSSELPLDGMDEAAAERFGQLAAGAPPADVLRKLLDGKLSHASRFVLRTVPTPIRGGGGAAYEIFHDVLAGPIRQWTNRFQKSCRLVADYWWTTLRLATATLFVALVLGAIGTYVGALRDRYLVEQRLQVATATLEWSRLSVGGGVLSSLELQALWNIARFSREESDRFVGLLRDDPGNVLKLAAHFGVLTRALGLQYGRIQNDTILAPIIAAIPRTAAADQLRTLAQAVQALGPRLQPAQAQAALAPVLAAITNTTNSNRLQALAQAAQALGPRLEPVQAQAALAPVLAAIPTTTDSFQLLALAQAVQTLGPTPAQAQAALAPVLAAITNTTDPSQLQALTQAVQALDPTPAQAQAALAPVLAAITDTTDSDQLWALAQAVQALGPRLEPAQAQAALAPVLAAIANTTDPSLLQALAQAVQALGPRLEPAQAQAALAPVLAAITNTTDPSQLSALAQAVQALGPNPAQAQAALAPVLAAITSTDPELLQVQAQLVLELGPRLEPADRVRAAEIARSGLAFAPDAVTAAAWAGALGGMMPEAPAEATLADIVELLKFPTAGLRGNDEDGSDGPTQVLLAALASRFPGIPALQTGKLDDLLAWIAKTYPSIDLDSPPQQPPPLRPDGPGTG